jgi:arylsulfatase A-like enzyme
MNRKDILRPRGRQGAPGGISPPLVIRRPAVIRAGGRITSQVGHVIDILPTRLDAAGAAHTGLKPSH